MKIVNHGSQFEVFSNDLKTYDELPAGTYRILFNPMSGYSLVKRSDFETIEEKIYGVHLSKIDKILTTFDSFPRSLGIMLSGDKGMGKSLFVQLLASEAIANGLPVIMVEQATPGLASFIDTIEQECLVIFDEFEKTFGRHGNGDDSQESFLGLFDGTSQKKRLYAITVNNIHHLSEYFLNRTGRFHYHFRFDYPTADEVREYMEDKLDAKYYGQIEYVVSFSKRTKLNYDMLRSIVFELNAGYSFAEAVKDLNILSIDLNEYTLSIEFTDGTKQTLRNEHLDLFQEEIFIRDSHNSNYYTIKFAPDALFVDQNRLVVDPNRLQIDWDQRNQVRVGDIFDDSQKQPEQRKVQQPGVKSLEIKQTVQGSSAFRYAV